MISVSIAGVGLKNRNLITPMSAENVRNVLKNKEMKPRVHRLRKQWMRELFKQMDAYQNAWLHIYTAVERMKQNRDNFASFHKPIPFGG